MQPSSVTFKGETIPNIKHTLLDSYVISGFVQNILGLDPATLFDSLQTSAPWTDPSNPDLKYRGRELARKKAFLVVSSDPEPLFDQAPSTMPRYSYPGFQHGSMRSYRDVRTVPEVHTMVESFNRDLVVDGQNVQLNHVILTCYRGADDNIGFHSDKTRDIAPNTPIISLSLGETREFHFGKADPNDKMRTITTDKFVLSSGDLFILGPKTNAAYRHSIVPVEDESIIKRGRVEVGPRISLVFRNIATIIGREEARKKAAVTEKRRAVKASEKSVAKRKKTAGKKAIVQGKKAAVKTAGKNARAKAQIKAKVQSKRTTIKNQMKRRK